MKDNKDKPVASATEPTPSEPSELTKRLLQDPRFKVLPTSGQAFVIGMHRAPMPPAVSPRQEVEVKTKPEATPWRFTKKDEEHYQALLAIASGVRQGDKLPYEWTEVCEEAPPRIVATALVSLSAIGTPGAQFEALRDQLEALRDAARTVVDAKLTDRLVTTMERLDTVATRLWSAAIVLAFLQVVLALVGVWIAAGRH